MPPAGPQSFCETKCATRPQDEAVILLKTHGKNNLKCTFFAEGCARRQGLLTASIASTL
jgi:hypothetical protein